MIKKRDLLNFLALNYSKYQLKKSFKYKDIDSIYNFTLKYKGRGYYDRIAMHQYKAEFIDFSNYVKQHDPKVVVEIGTKKGGSFFVWARYFKPSLLISIDLPGGIHGGGFPKQKIPFLKYFLKDQNESKVSIIQGDSHDASTVKKLNDVLNGRLIDFLFIDGDHRYEGVKSDFLMYKDLVKPGGLIGFHDIVSSDYHHNMQCFVDKLWNEIKSDYEYKEFIQNPHQHKYGLGVIKL